MRKYFKYIVMLGLCLTVLTGCSKKTDVRPESTEASTAEVEVKSGTTIEDGVLLVGISSSPYITEDEDGKVEGFEIDLAKAIGELTFLDVRFIKMKYTGIYAELDTSAFDCVISGIAISDTVDEVYDFSASYYTDENGNDVSLEYDKAVAVALSKIQNEEIDLVILQSRSPTCGVNQIYDGSFTGKLIPGMGLFAKALKQRGYNVIDVEEI